jgi:hypothetical protein
MPSRDRRKEALVFVILRTGTSSSAIPLVNGGG